MDKSNIKGYILRLKQTLDLYSQELVQGYINKDSPGKSQSSRLKRNQLLSRIIHLTKSIRKIIFSGHILEVTYLQQSPNHPDRKFKAILTDISQMDFEYFVREMNKTENGPKLVILEIKEIPTFIKEVPL